MGKPWHETAYTCGLVHDIGKVARFKLDEVDNTEYFIKDTKLAQSEDISSLKRISQSERTPRLSRYLLCRNWGLSAWVESVVMWHHEDQIDRRRGVPSSDANTLIDIVIVANWLAQYHKFGNSGHNSPEMPSDALFQRLNLSEHVQELSDQCTYILRKKKNFQGLSRGRSRIWGSAGTQAVFRKKPSVKPQVGSQVCPVLLLESRFLRLRL